MDGELVPVQVKRYERLIKGFRVAMHLDRSCGQLMSIDTALRSYYDRVRRGFFRKEHFGITRRCQKTETCSFEVIDQNPQMMEPNPVDPHYVNGRCLARHRASLPGA